MATTPTPGDHMDRQDEVDDVELCRHGQEVYQGAFPGCCDWRCECGDLNRRQEASCYRCGAGQPEDVYEEVKIERDRAHAKHGDTSMESFPVDDMNRLAILVEEVGEVWPRQSPTTSRRAGTAEWQN